MPNSQPSSNEYFPNPLELLAEYQEAVKYGWSSGQEEWLKEKLAGIELKELRAKIAYENLPEGKAEKVKILEQKKARITWDKATHCRTGERFDNEFDYVVHQSQFGLPIIATNQIWKDDINPYDEFIERQQQKLKDLLG
jgi:hypothetical protein